MAAAAEDQVLPAGPTATEPRESEEAKTPMTAAAEDRVLPAGPTTTEPRESEEAKAPMTGAAEDQVLPAGPTATEPRESEEPRTPMTGKAASRKRTSTSAAGSPSPRLRRFASSFSTVTKAASFFGQDSEHKRRHRMTMMYIGGIAPILLASIGTLVTACVTRIVHRGWFLDPIAVAFSGPQEGHEPHSKTYDQVLTSHVVFSLLWVVVIFSQVASMLLSRRWLWLRKLHGKVGRWAAPPIVALMLVLSLAAIGSNDTYRPDQMVGALVLTLTSALVITVNFTLAIYYAVVKRDIPTHKGYIFNAILWTLGAGFNRFWFSILQVMWPDCDIQHVGLMLGCVVSQAVMIATILTIGVSLGDTYPRYLRVNVFMNTLFLVLYIVIAGYLLGTKQDGAVCFGV